MSTTVLIERYARTHPGRTDREIATALGLGHQQVESVSGAGTASVVRRGGRLIRGALTTSSVHAVRTLSVPPHQGGWGSRTIHPLAARLTPTNVADNEVAPHLVADLPAEVRFVLGDRHYGAPEVRAACDRDGRILVTTRSGRYPHTDDGVAVRRVFHKLRSTAIENFNGQFKGIFDVQGAVPTRGLTNTRRFALGAVVVCQLTLWHRHEQGLDLRVGLDPFLKAA